LIRLDSFAEQVSKITGTVTHRRTTLRVRYFSPMLSRPLLVCLTGCLFLSAGCTAAPSFVNSLIAGEAPADETYAGRQHFPVTPSEAVECLIEVAPQQGWDVVSTGDEQATYGERGKFFRLEPTKSSGGRQPVSGIFYAEPSGSYVRISEQNGLPETLVEPLIAEIKRKRGSR
jgi:hypothetical protein